MGHLKKLVMTAAVVVLALCIYAFMLGTKMFEGKFENDAIPWYFLAKGIFCSLSLYLSFRVLETLEGMKK